MSSFEARFLLREIADVPNPCTCWVTILMMEDKSFDIRIMMLSDPELEREAPRGFNNANHCMKYKLRGESRKSRQKPHAPVFTFKMAKEQSMKRLPYAICIKLLSLLHECDQGFKQYEQAVAEGVGSAQRAAWFPAPSESGLKDGSLKIITGLFETVATQLVHSGVSE